LVGIAVAVFADLFYAAYKFCEIVSKKVDLKGSGLMEVVAVKVIRLDGNCDTVRLDFQRTRSIAYSNFIHHITLNITLLYSYKVCPVVPPYVNAD
jgi:hypothetical protein